MAEMVRSDWNEFVDDAVDELLTVVRPGTPIAEQITIEQPRREIRVFGLEDDLRRPHESSDARYLLTSYSMRLLTAARAGGVARCKHGGKTVDCEYILSPDQEPHYRCVGHSPPHCYDSDGRSISCP